VRWRDVGGRLDARSDVELGADMVV
jgi:hypothetical protein